MNNSTLSILEVLSIDQAFLSMFKIFFIIGGFLYLIFAVVVIRQIAIMKKSLITPLSPFITTLGYVHLLITLGALFYFFFLI